MNKLELKVKLTPIKANLSCLNCICDTEIKFNEQTVEDYNLRKIRNEGFVMSELKCQECGCNTFNTDIYYEMDMKG